MRPGVRRNVSVFFLMAEWNFIHGRERAMWFTLFEEQFRCSLVTNECNSSVTEL